ncbi:MAG: hypothetical protein HC773_19500 [Scytonema sp. CRU_2_7]|nr:hypothetical protein [Scytonema sp. CRU_2_7]
MALTPFKIIQPNGAPSGGEQVMQSLTWGENATAFFNNGVIALPKVAGTTGYMVVQGVAGQWEYAPVPSTPASVGLGNVLNVAQISRAIGTDKGDLIVYTANDAPDRLPVGTDGQVLQADSAEPYGVKWATGSGGSPGGANTQIQFNNGGAFGGASAFTYITATGKITMNVGAGAGGDFEILKQTSGTLLFADVSASLVIIGANSTSPGPGTTVLSVEGGNIFANASGGANLVLQRTGALASGSQATAVIFRSDDVSGNNGNLVTLLSYLDGATAGNEGGELRLFCKNNNAGTATTTVFFRSTSISFFDAETGFYGGKGITIVGSSTAGQFPTVNLRSKEANADNLVLGAFYGYGVSGANNSLRSTIQFKQAGTDGTNPGGAIEFGTQTNGNAGFFNHVRLDNDGKFTVNLNFRTLADFEVRKQTSGIALFVDVSTSQVVIGSNTVFTNADLMLDVGGWLGLKETATPTGTTNYGKIYTKSDNLLYFQDGDGVEHLVTIV